MTARESRGKDWKPSARPLDEELPLYRLLRPLQGHLDLDSRAPSADFGFFIRAGLVDRPLVFSANGVD